MAVPAEGIEARPRMTAKTFLVTLGLSVAFAITAVDPLLLTLNLSKVGRGLDVPANLIGFLGSAATLVVASAVLAVGNLGDIYGLKRLLMYGLGAGVLFGLLAALSPNHLFLLATRLADGLALSALLGLSLALLTVSVPPEVRPKAIGIFMATDAILYGVTPLVGGWVVETLGWRGLFLITPLLALAALALIARYVAEPPRQPGRGLDPVGVSLFGAALLSLVFGIGATQNGLTSPQAWVPLAGAGLALVAFLRHERQVREPALDLALFSKRAFVVAALVALTFNFLSAGLGVVLGQFGGVVLALPAETIGLFYLPGTILLAGASILSGRLVARHTARPVFVTGLLVLAASGLVLAATASPTMALWGLVLVTWLCNLGCFLLATPVSDTILSHAGTGTTGSVAAVQPAFGMTGYALGPTIYILLLNLFFQRRWLADAESRGLSAKQAEHAVDAVKSAMASSPGTTRFDPNLIQQASGLSLRLDYTNGLRLTMLVVTLAPLALAILAHFLIPRRRSGP